MRERQSARLLVINPECKVLLFRFVHKEGALAGDDYWATPGGGLEHGETFEVAAIRELHEETGIVVSQIGTSLRESAFPLRLPSGEMVTAVERYFVVQAQDQALSRAGWTLQETQVMAEHRWWSASDLRATGETVWPQFLVDMLEEAGVF